MKTNNPRAHEAASQTFSEKYVERKLYRPTHLALLPMTARNSLETGEETQLRQREEDEKLMEPLKRVM